MGPVSGSDRAGFRNIGTVERVDVLKRCTHAVGEADCASVIELPHHHVSMLSRALLVDLSS